MVERDREGAYAVERGELERYLVPKDASATSRERVRETGGGVAYTHSATAYVFECRA